MASALTTVALVKERLGFEASDTQFDDVLGTVVAEVCDRCEADMHRSIAKASRTDLLEGSGTHRLILPDGPLFDTPAPVVKKKTYAESVTDDVVTASRYRLSGLSGKTLGRGELIRVDGRCWDRAADVLYEVVHTSGFDPVPPSVQGWATTEVVSIFLGRAESGRSGSSDGEASVSLLSPAQLDASRWRALAPYVLPVFA